VAFGIDRRGVPGKLVGTVGDDLAFTVALIDFEAGAITGTGATIVSTVGGASTAVSYAVQGLFVCTLTDAQTTSLGAGSHAWVFKLTPSGGDTQTYVSGTVTLLAAGSNAGGSYGWQGGIVGDVLVGIA